MCGTDTTWSGGRYWSQHVGVEAHQTANIWVTHVQTWFLNKYPWSWDPTPEGHWLSDGTRRQSLTGIPNFISMFLSFGNSGDCLINNLWTRWLLLDFGTLKASISLGKDLGMCLKLAHSHDKLCIYPRFGFFLSEEKLCIYQSFRNDNMRNYRKNMCNGIRSLKSVIEDSSFPLENRTYFGYHPFVKRVVIKVNSGGFRHKLWSYFKGKGIRIYWLWTNPNPPLSVFSE